MATDMTTLSDEAQSLARVPLFKRLEPHELEKLAEEIDQVNYKAGEVIFNEHDRCDALYVLEEGCVVWRFVDVHHYLLTLSYRLDGVQYFCARALREWSRGKAVRRVSLHSSQPDALNDGSPASAHHHDVAKPRRRKRPTRRGAGY